MAAGTNDELFSSLIANIKNYTGSDPLRPWLQGIRRMKETLPPQILKEKLPRFLQKCAQTFEDNRRYQNDSRYVRVWIQLMDYVDDARMILRKMEKNNIGLRRAMFYSAYALYYEKQKKFEEAENMYLLGVQNLAEPVDELQKSYEQFLHRMKLLKERKARKLMLSCGQSNRIPPRQWKTTMTENRRVEKGEASQISHSTLKSGDQDKRSKPLNLTKPPSGGGSRDSTSSFDATLNTTTNLNAVTDKFQASLSKYDPGSETVKNFCGNQGKTTYSGDDTVVVKFVGSAIVGKSEAEDACHHGLVDPTVNMKEAMNAISSMFKQPLEPEPVPRRRAHQSKPKESQQSNVLEVFVDESMEELKKQTETKSQKPFVGAFKIWTEEDDDDDGSDDDEDDNDNYDNGDGVEAKEHIDIPKPICKINSSEDVRLNGDTVIRRFVGSTVFDDPVVENSCHHGLVDPTINMKEAMDDINSMFGEPLNFVRAGRPKKQTKPVEQKPASQGFSILADDDLEENSRAPASKSISSKFGGESELFEQTVFTREAMADINEMFGKPLDF